MSKGALMVSEIKDFNKMMMMMMKMTPASLSEFSGNP